LSPRLPAYHPWQAPGLDLSATPFSLACVGPYPRTQLPSGHLLQAHSFEAASLYKP
jgi:hypothetical protein